MVLSNQVEDTRKLEKRSVDIAEEVSRSKGSSVDYRQSKYEVWIGFV